MPSAGIAVPQDQLDATFTALADPTRRAIVARLARGDATVNELAAPFDLTLPGISKHLKVLSAAGSSRGPGTPSSGPATSRPGRSE
jgi:predicted ArsR family transcriptional regulator